LRSLANQTTYTRPARVTSDPVKVYRKNLVLAATRLVEPNTRIRMNMGSSVNSKQM
jgi:hypothetical protein